MKDMMEQGVAGLCSPVSGRCSLAALTGAALAPEAPLTSGPLAQLCSNSRASQPDCSPGGLKSQPSNNS